MKSYLPLKRAAIIAGRDADDLVLLCQADRIDCRKTDSDWFVAEEEIVNTLSMMNKEVLESELVDLRKHREHYAQLDFTEKTSQKLFHATAVILVMLFGAMAIFAWSVNIAEHGGLAYQLDTLNNNLAAIAGIWR